MGDLSIFAPAVAEEWDAESAFDLMVWAVPKFKPEALNRAGKHLVATLYDDGAIWSSEEWRDYLESAEIINNWRASHAYPLNTFQMNLRGAARRFDKAPLIAQRTKRLISIGVKLERFPKMKLSQMQDIGGCRAVVNSVAAVRALNRYYHRESQVKHHLASMDDYIANPQNSGYRGIHRVYRYFSDKPAKAIYNGLKIEMQLRSQYQHAWATAVETVGTFVGQALKSSVGEKEWLRFFSLMGSAVARRERTPLVANTPTSKNELRDELDHYAITLDVENRLQTYCDTLQRVNESDDDQDAHYYLLRLDPKSNQLTVTGFKANELDSATSAYLDAEKAVKERPGTDAVLVSVESLAALPRAYPNYFADTRIFLQLMKQALSGHQRKIFTPALKVDQPTSADPGAPAS